MFDLFWLAFVQSWLPPFEVARDSPHANAFGVREADPESPLAVTGNWASSSSG